MDQKFKNIVLTYVRYDGLVLRTSVGQLGIHLNNTYLTLMALTTVCTYVRTYIRTYVRAYVRVDVCMDVRMYVCTYVRTYVSTYVRTYVRTYVCDGPDRKLEHP